MERDWFGRRSTTKMQRFAQKGTRPINRSRGKARARYLFVFAADAINTPNLWPVNASIPVTPTDFDRFVLLFKIDWLENLFEPLKNEVFWNLLRRKEIQVVWEEFYCYCFLMVKLSVLATDKNDSTSRELISLIKGDLSAHWPTYWHVDYMKGYS